MRIIPTTQEKKVQLIRENVLPLLDSQLDSDLADDVEQSKIERSKTILAEEYLFKAYDAIKFVFKLSLGLLLLDSLTYMPTQVYGLVFSTTGTLIILVESDLFGSEAIAARSRESSGATFGGGFYLNEDRARRLAQNTVNANIGLLWLVSGFLLQILSIWALSPGTLIEPVVQMSSLY